MTNEEAIKCLECDFYNMECCAEKECKCNEAITMAIEALEKQVLKKPVKQKRHSVFYSTYCPTCGFSVISPENEKYCGKCGQAIDWCEV